MAKTLDRADIGSKILAALGLRPDHVDRIDRGLREFAGAIRVCSLQFGRVIQEAKPLARQFAEALMRMHAAPRVAQARDQSCLVKSRRAESLRRTLQPGLGSDEFDKSFAAAGIPEERYAFGELVAQAASRSPAACDRLADICAQIKPHLIDPRGRIASLASATHEVLLAGSRQPVSAGGSLDVYEDPATRGTRQAFNDPDCDPRPARRRVRKLQQKERAKRCS